MLLPPAWSSVTLEIVAPPKRTKSTMVSFAALAAPKVAFAELLPVKFEPRALRTSTGGTPLSVTVDPVPLAAGVIVPEIE